MRIAIFIFILAWSGCKSQNEAIKESEAMQANQEVLAPFLQDDYSGGEAEETMIIEDAKQLKSFFRQINKTRKPGIAMPDVDFTQNMVLIYCSGTRNDGAMPELKKSRENDNELVLEATHRMPEKKVSYISSPFSLYIMPLTDKTIIFESNSR